LGSCPYIHAYFLTDAGEIEMEKLVDAMEAFTGG
jgi:hypothetical protein